MTLGKLPEAPDVYATVMGKLLWFTMRNRVPTLPPPSNVYVRGAVGFAMMMLSAFCGKMMVPRLFAPFPKEKVVFASGPFAWMSPCVVTMAAVPVMVSELGENVSGLSQKMTCKKFAMTAPVQVTETAPLVENAPSRWSVA